MRTQPPRNNILRYLPNFYDFRAIIKYRSYKKGVHSY